MMKNNLEWYIQRGSFGAVCAFICMMNRKNIKENIEKAEAEAIKAKLEEVGAEVEMK